MKNGWRVVGATPSIWNFGSAGPRWSEIADIQPIFTRSFLAVTPSKKVQLTLIGSPMRFPLSLRWSSYVALKFQGGSQKRKIGRFPFKIALSLKKVCYKVSLCENCQRHSCKAFIGLTNRAKMISGGRPLLPEILDQRDRIGAKSPIFDVFARSDSAVTPSEKHQLTLIGSPLRAFHWAQDEHRTLSLSPPPKGGSKNKVSEIWTISCDNSEAVRDRMSVIINH